MCGSGLECLAGGVTRHGLSTGNDGRLCRFDLDCFEEWLLLVDGRTGSRRLRRLETKKAPMEPAQSGTRNMAHRFVEDQAAKSSRQAF